MIYATQTHSVRKLVNMIDTGVLKIDTAPHKDVEWDGYGKTLLVNSVLRNMPINPLMFVFNASDNTYDLVQGKQRCKAVYDFVKGKYKLSPKIPPLIKPMENDMIEVDLGKCTFSEIPCELQDAILDYAFLVWVLLNPTDDDVSELCMRMNYSKPLTDKDLPKPKSKQTYDFREITKHPAIQATFTKAVNQRLDDNFIAVKIWIICCKENPCLVSDYVNQQLRNSRITQQEKTDILSSLDYVTTLLGYLTSSAQRKKIYRTIKSRTHFVSVAYMAYVAIRENIPIETYISKVEDFFNSGTLHKSISQVYNDVTGPNNNEVNDVQIRINELRKALLG